MSSPHRPSYSHTALTHKRTARVGIFLIVAGVALYALYGHALRTAILSVENPFGSPYTDDIPAPDVDWNSRAEQVKGSFKHAYHGYEKHAAPADELKPISKSKHNPLVCSTLVNLEMCLLLRVEPQIQRMGSDHF